MEKHVIDRRVAQMEAEGVTFHLWQGHVGGSSPMARSIRSELLNELRRGRADRRLPKRLAICRSPVANSRRRSLSRWISCRSRIAASADEPLGGAADILAGGKHVVVIGGGDTGSDCIGTSFRQGALSVTQLEIMPAPPEHEDKMPDVAELAAQDADLVEPGRRRGKRDYAVLTQKFSGGDGKVAKLHCIQRRSDNFKPVPGSEFDLDAQLVLLAMGFVHPVHEGLLKTLESRSRPARQRPRQHDRTTRPRVPKVFSAGDMRRGQSLVVWAIREGRLCARAIDQFLMGTTHLPR